MVCEEGKPSLTKERLVISPISAYPFQMVVTDLFNKNGYQYLAYDDRLIGWIELAYFRQDPDSSDIIDSTTVLLAGLNSHIFVKIHILVT